MAVVAEVDADHAMTAWCAGWTGSRWNTPTPRRPIGDRTLIERFKVHRKKKVGSKKQKTRKPSIGAGFKEIIGGEGVRTQAVQTRLNKRKIDPQLSV